MVPFLFKEIRGVSFSCASSSSVAICKSIGSKITSRRAINNHHERPLNNSQRMNSKSTSNPKVQYQELNIKNLTGRSSEELTDLLSPSNSSLYLLSPTKFLLNEADFFDIIPVPGPIPLEVSKPQWIGGDELSASRPKDQVVVMRVSLHCKGCEGKVRKHISKMEGVTSFSIDLATKKVTVIGDVTPLDVLNSVTKVKNAQFWPPSSSSSSSTSF
ncbi:protein SODIUM POTASSIUM ROOT DEFECTIVE 3 [Canna indica]|uniref:Protein SODIUM POTASSIUM ROOT DEFECTIVE 3 n=1 Tax=Canna indica TaxID=4628 RepID=A0AAQ3QJE1_9LILI|nr:protein SODIUM POTASSIUM ROOT DEFECTIVE 3 [Canna indica]